MNGRNKKEKGITLIALIVTIVVLIILATISMFAVFGDNGIIVKAQEAKRMHEKGKSTEENRLDDYTKYIGNYMKNEEHGKDNTIDENGEGDKEDPEWKKITALERMEKLKNLDARLEVFNSDVAGTTNDINKKTAKYENNNLIYNNGKYVYDISGEKYTSIDVAKCECGKVREIYDKAKEMGLVKIYDEMEDAIKESQKNDGSMESTFYRYNSNSNCKRTKFSII